VCPARSPQNRGLRADSLYSLVLERETDLECHLPVTDFAIIDVSARLGDLKPTHIADGLPGTGQRNLYRLLKTILLGANQYNIHIYVIRHLPIIT
jgi:hypothetical protein